MLAKTAGVKHLVILVNKMDDSTVQWSQERSVKSRNIYIWYYILSLIVYSTFISYEECETKLVPFLKKAGFNKKSGNLYLFAYISFSLHVNDIACNQH